MLVYFQVFCTHVGSVVLKGSSQIKKYCIFPHHIITSCLSCELFSVKHASRRPELRRQTQHRHTVVVRRGNKSLTERKDGGKESEGCFWGGD